MSICSIYMWNQGTWEKEQMEDEFFLRKVEKWEKGWEGGARSIHWETETHWAFNIHMKL